MQGTGNAAKRDWTIKKETFLIGWGDRLLELERHCPRSVLLSAKGWPPLRPTVECCRWRRQRRWPEKAARPSRDRGRPTEEKERETRRVDFRVQPRGARATRWLGWPGGRQRIYARQWIPTRPHIVRTNVRAQKHALYVCTCNTCIRIRRFRVSQLNLVTQQWRIVEMKNYRQLKLNCR